MTNVAKYNTCKGVSSALTFGTPIVALASCGDFIKHRPETTISAAGIFVIILVLFFMKDKIFEYFKTPPAAVLSFALLIFILLIENIILPMKAVCIATMIVCGIDEVTFKHWYKTVEKVLPGIAENYKHVGFIFAKTNTILEASKCQNDQKN
jgi:hypothetical protein